MGQDASRNNNFRYDFTDDQTTTIRCPFAAHTRKTNPRADLEDIGFSTETRRIIRRGVQFGDEVTPQEAASGKTALDRYASLCQSSTQRILTVFHSGLIFAAYQSTIPNGFQFIQISE